MQKICSKCDIEKQTSDFHKDKTTPDGFKYKCKECTKLYTNSPETKKRRKDYWKIYSSNNREMLNEKNKEDYYNNHEERKQVKRKYMAENKDKFKEYQKGWVKNNNKHVREYMLNWQKENPELFRHHSSKRKAAKLQAIPKFANLDKIKEVYQEAAELQKQDGIPRHVDHIIPLQGKNVCGLHVETNLQILTAEENILKSNKFKTE
jgi:hypothetical protein